MNILHAIEQMMAALRDVSPMLWSYKEDLKKQGFTEEQAFQLVRDFQKVTFSNKGDGK